MELKKLPHIEIEVAPLPGKKLPAAVNTLRKLDVKKVGLIAGGTAGGGEGRRGRNHLKREPVS